MATNGDLIWPPPRTFSWPWTLARYRLEWTGSEMDPTAEAIVNVWYGDLEELDSMGGVHPTC